MVASAIAIGLQQVSVSGHSYETLQEENDYSFANEIFFAEMQIYF